MMSEKVDVFFTYDEYCKRETAARNWYAERYPNRVSLDLGLIYITKVERYLDRERLRNQKAIVIIEETEIKVLASVEIDPTVLFAKYSMIWKCPKKVYRKF